MLKKETNFEGTITLNKYGEVNMEEFGLSSVCKMCYFSIENSDELIFANNEEIIKFNYIDKE